MTKKVALFRVSGISVGIILLGFGFYWFYTHSITIKSIKLESPYNYAFQEDIIVDLDKEASIEVK